MTVTPADDDLISAPDDGFAPASVASRWKRNENFVLGTLAVFEEELALHLRTGRCSGRDRGVLPVGSKRG